MDKKGLGSRIKTARKERGLTAEKLAELCNINAIYLRQIEAGTKTPSLPMFVELSKQLKASPTLLLSDSLGEETTSFESIIQLLKTATPSQAALISRMIDTALSVLKEDR